MTEPPETDQAADPGLTRDGSPSYLHIPAADVRAAAAFYRDVFGWTIHNADSDRPGFETPNGSLGGAWMGNQTPMREAGLLLYIYVDDVDGTVAKITGNGGEMVTEPYPQGTLRVATFRDPAGNLLGLWHETQRDV
jgi:predicted enzyme related to lactoylglutathione lyase